MNLLEECLAAYGGLDRWRAEEAVEVRVSARGLAFLMKGNGHPLTGARARVRTSGQHVEFFDWPRPGATALLTSEEVRIGGERRAQPRFGRRWDDLDFVAFGGAAMWTYVSLPFVLADWGADELPGAPPALPRAGADPQPLPRADDPPRRELPDRQARLHGRGVRPVGARRAPELALRDL